MSAHALNVRRLRFRGRLANPLAARGRVETALTAGAEAARLGSEAILCVRRIAISLPRLDRLSGSLDAEILRAARPARGAVPANTNAVLFADRAELLACLARDWCAGNTTARWWWPLLFPRDDFAAIVRRAWLEDARPVPAALARLESVGLAARFLAKLSSTDVAALWGNIVNTFHLPAHLDEAWSATELPPGPAVVRRAREAAPWSPWITPESSLTTDVARVFITAVLLERAPAKVYSVSFAQEVRAWTRSRETSPAPELESRMFPLAEDPSTTRKPSPSLPAPVILPSTRNAPPPNATRFAPVASPQAQAAGVQMPAPPTRPQERFSKSRMAEDQSRTTHFEEGKPMAASTTATHETVALPSAALPDSTATKWGGTLYLVNVAIALELYGGFTNPARPGLALPLWDFLALLGRRMIGEEFAEDPLFRLFARLSVRAEDEPPGAQFEPPSGESLSIWLDRICHDVQARVAASLGLRDDCDLRALVLNHYAKIETTSARVDAHFALAAHPIELRVAGLDRDPGWVPAGGRSIYFHYD